MTMSMASSLNLALYVIAIVSLQGTLTLATQKTYIVYLGVHQHGMNPTEVDANIATQSHYDLMGSVLGSYEKAQKSVLYSYNKYINGFVANLADDEVERIKASPNVVSVIENTHLEYLTTRSWEFLGLERNGVTPSDSLWNISRYGNDIIIANIDSGVWPESESFNDEGYTQIPSRWKGECMTGSDKTFKCNKKLIGARHFRILDKISTKTFNDSAVIVSPRDQEGHGTHTLSTLGGNFVKEVSAFGFGKGVAKGGSPNARVAAYKVSWPDVGINSANTLAAFEAAISDGVDVLSLSISNQQWVDYKVDSIAIGSFHAVRHGITLVASAGNKGPKPGSVANIAPWIFTVGASTIDREFYNEVYLGNSTFHVKGADFGATSFPEKSFYPIIVGASAAVNETTIDKANFCIEGSLDPLKVKGKIVVCEIGDESKHAPKTKGGVVIISKGLTVLKGSVVKAAGGVGMILVNGATDVDTIRPEMHLLPASHISYKNSQVVLDYINKTINPTAYISDVTTITNTKPAPVMANYSSRGPSAKYPFILKPDITAPGDNIIAAFTGAKSPSDFKGDTRRVRYSSLSGTSMSCPHVAGVVGLIKSVHPDWSPAAIRSAIMTTATTFANDNKTIQDLNGEPATPFGYGAGHINPNAAANPGLIYNLTEIDYLDYLCSLGNYTENDLKLFSPIPHKCINSKSILDFNYPSMTVTNFTSSVNLTRVVTNVGNPGTYEVKVTAPFGVDVVVIPSKLNFNQTGEEQKFRVELKATGERPKEPEYVYGSLVWTDGTHSVRSPLVVQRS